MPKISELPVGITATGAEIIPAVQSSVTVGLTASQLVSGLSRERLIANRNYYVRTDGSDSNTGLANTAAAAFLTIQKAIDVTCTLDMSIFAVTINIADGTYTGAIVCKAYVGVGPITLLGNATTPANVNISVTSATCVTGAIGFSGRYTLNGMKLTALTTGFNCINCSQFARILYLNINFGTASTHVICTFDAQALSAGPSTISGSAAIHWASTTNALISDAGQTITLTGTPAFSQAFAVASEAGLLRINGNTFVGSATGVRYTGDSLALINTGGGGANYLPGNAAGSLSNGAVYV